MLKRLLLLAALFSPLGAQSTPSPNLAGIAHIALRVKDLDASVAFYQKLGFVKAFDLARDGKVYEAFIKINDRQFIELYPVDAKNAQVGFLHVCFEAGDIQSVHDYYVAQGLHPIDVRKAGAGNLLFTMPGPMTPQGAQNMEYTQYMPGSLHSNDFGKHLGPDRVATELRNVTLGANDPEAAKSFYKDRVDFPPATPTSAYFHIPGSKEDIILATAESLGQRASIDLATSNDTVPTARRLRAAGFSDLGLGAPLRLIDPDGNIVNILTTSVAPTITVR